jgi:hypothetical protein
MQKLESKHLLLFVKFAPTPSTEQSVGLLSPNQSTGWLAAEHFEPLPAPALAVYSSG